MISDKNKRVQITFDKGILEKLKRIAKKDDRTISYILNNLVKNIEED